MRIEKVCWLHKWYQALWRWGIREPMYCHEILWHLQVINKMGGLYPWLSFGVARVVLLSICVLWQLISYIVYDLGVLAVMQNIQVIGSMQSNKLFTIGS